MERTTKRNIAIYVGAIIVGSVAGVSLAEYLMARIYIVIAVLVVFTFVVAFLLNRNTKSGESGTRP